jgi:hypothetical protein
MFRAAHRSSSGALTVFAASGWHTHVVTSRNEFWVVTVPTRTSLQPVTTCICQPEAAKTELLKISGVPLATCWAFNESWNNKFYYKVAFCWLFLLSHTTMHGSMNIKSISLFPFRSDRFIIRWTKGIEERPNVTIKLNKTKHIFARNWDVQVTKKN